MPFMSSVAGSFGAVSRFRKKPVVVPVLTGTYYSTYTSFTSPLTFSTGVAKIVLNGYGILFYGWHANTTTTSMHPVSLPADLIGQQIDITIIGGGGEHSGGGGGGGAGAGGGRHLATLTNNQVYLKTGTHLFYAESLTDVTGSIEYRNTRFYAESGSIDLYGPHAGESTGSTASGCNVYNYKGPNSTSPASLSSSNASNLSYIQARDTTFQYCYGGSGCGLNGFSTGYPNGSDLGGGGGAQDYVNYGGSAAAGTGGRYGYSGGVRNGAGNGPVGGVVNRSATYQKGAGGSFGAGVGDAGNNDSYYTPGGGAILIRWDTTLATFQSGTPGWP